jgi:hypothetical protein
MYLIGPETTRSTAKIERLWPWKKIMRIFPSLLTAKPGLRYKEVSSFSKRNGIHTTVSDICHIGIVLHPSSPPSGGEDE